LPPLYLTSYLFNYSTYVLDATKWQKVPYIHSILKYLPLDVVLLHDTDPSVDMQKTYPFRIGPLLSMLALRTFHLHAIVIFIKNQFPEKTFCNSSIAES